MNNPTHTYEDIINLPHHTSSVHPRLAMSQRAAQFAPFVALSGYDEAIARSTRLNEERFTSAPDSDPSWPDFL